MRRVSNVEAKTFPIDDLNAEYVDGAKGCRDRLLVLDGVDDAGYACMAVASEQAGACREVGRSVCHGAVHPRRCGDGDPVHSNQRACFRNALLLRRSGVGQACYPPWARWVSMATWNRTTAWSITRTSSLSTASALHKRQASCGLVEYDILI